MESEIRDILNRALKLESGIKIGDALAAIGRRSELTNDDFEMFEKARCEMPAEPVRFE
jgi:plasmid stability protein